MKSRKTRRWADLIAALLALVYVLAAAPQFGMAVNIEDFPDVSAEHDRYSDLAWVAHHNIMIGREYWYQTEDGQWEIETRMAADEEILRNELAAVLSRLMGCYTVADVSGVVDLDTGGWDYEYWGHMAQLKIMETGDGESWTNSRQANPYGFVSKLEAVKTITKLLYPAEALHYSSMEEFAKAIYRSIGADDDLTAFVLRGEIASLLRYFVRDIWYSGEYSGMQTGRGVTLVRGPVSIHDATFSDSLVIANSLQDASLELAQIQIQAGALVTWGSSTLYVTGRSLVTAVATARNDGTNTVIFDQEATALSEPVATVLEPENMDPDNKVIWSTGEDPQPTPTPPPDEEPTPTPEPEKEHKPISIVLVDWDNKVLGTIPVLSNTDVRALVNSATAGLIHPDLQTADLGSLARVDTYRGEYPATCPMSADVTSEPTIVSDGANYPLSNKLDYVLFKRVMEKSGAQYIQTAAYDTEYPYIHCWAECSMKNYKDIWTTLGMGELADYSGASNGGYAELNGAPASFSYTGTGFALPNLEEGFEDNVILKAIYEPGTELLDVGGLYRMVEVPHYGIITHSQNGLHSYSEMAYERSYIDAQGNLHGVARARELTMDTMRTIDLRYGFTGEELESLCKLYETEGYKIFDENHGYHAEVKPTLDNGNQARFKIDIAPSTLGINNVLKDKWRTNFVVGPERSLTNMDYWALCGESEDEGSCYQLPAHNALMADSNLDDLYYDAPYEEYVGTLGAELVGWLNSAMEYATLEYYSGDNSGNYSQSKNKGLNLSLLVIYAFDLNIRLSNFNDPEASQMDRLFSHRYCEKLVALVPLCADHIGQADEKDYWDAEHDCANLNWHQIQLWIRDGVLYSRKDANNILIPWCKIHETCVEYGKSLYP